MKSLTYFEIDLKRCALVYGVSPCTASLDTSPPTGDRKCYNCPATCQDTPNFSPTTLTLRFAIGTDYLPLDIACIPSMRDVSVQPQKINPGESLGERELVNISFNDHPYNDVGIDPYYTERGFDPYQVGSFWPKFKARWPYIQGSACRLIRGFEGQTLEEMETRHYVVESSAGPNSDGVFTISARDYIKLLDGNKSQAPIASNGKLLSGIDNNDTSITLTPAGIGDAEYPASGVASIGDEQVTFTRSADVITLTARGLEGSEAVDHEAGETFQLGIFYDGEDPADIIYDLIVNYTDTDPATINLPAWQLETSIYIGREYSAKILKPESVRSLVDELINQVGLVIYSDTINQTIELRALRQFVTLQTVDDNSIIEDSLTVKDQQDKRTSQVWTFYGRRNPLKNLDEAQNYRSVFVRLGDESVAVLEDRQSAIRKIFSRWITIINSPAAQGLNDIVIRRYQNAPRQFGFRLPLDLTPVLGAGIQIQHRNLQDDQGNASIATAQIISLLKTESDYQVVAEEMTFVQQSAQDRLIVIDQNSFNLDPYFNLRAAHDSIYDDPESGDSVNCVIQSGVIVGSKKNTDFAFIIGDWPAGVSIKITNMGRIQGRGGDSGLGAFQNPSKKAGGGAFYTRYPVTIDNTNGEIWGGGGASGNTLGGAGAGYKPGAGHTSTSAATTEAGGIGGSFGDGGGPGEDGDDNSGVPGGEAGAAIDGESYVTFISEGDIRGSMIG